MSQQTHYYQGRDFYGSNDPPTVYNFELTGG